VMKDMYDGAIAITRTIGGETKPFFVRNKANPRIGIILI